jgi:hypothetical protein
MPRTIRSILTPAVLAAYSSSIAQALLDAREEVLGPARGLEIGVARDADGVAGEDVVAGVDRR